MSRMTKRALITGGAGFIGSHLAEALLDRGYHVTIIDDLSTGTFANIGRLVERDGSDGGPTFRFAIDTITNEAVLDRLASQCDVIFHLAAAVGVKLIMENPVHTLETNVMGTEVVLKAALRYRAKVLIASTSEVYGKGNRIPFREDDDVVLGPTSRNRWGYAASKMVDEFLALAYHHEKGLPVVIFRLFNTVGPRQSGQYGMVLPRFVQQALSERVEPLTVHGDGQQSRCFLHVRDAVAAVIALAECQPAVGQVFNVGSNEEITMLDVANRVLRIVESAHARCEGPGETMEARTVLVPYEEVYANGFEDMRRRVPDLTKIQSYTGWAPSYSLEQILQDIVAYARSQPAGSYQN